MDGKALVPLVAVIWMGAIAVGTLGLHAGGPPEAPPRPEPPPAPAELMNSTLKFSSSIYRALLEQDARRFRVPMPAAVEWVQPHSYFDELRERRKLQQRVPVQSAHLKITLDVTKRKALMQGQNFAVDHLFLRIQNLTARFIAYRVETRPLDETKCTRKFEMAHNALVLEPHQTIERTECLYSSEQAITLLRVEVMELTPLGAYYVSKLPPNPVLVDARTSAGHVPLEGTVCQQSFSWRDIQDGIDRGELGWRDVIDFYARHSCEEYTFFKDYRFRVDPGAPLPARPLE